MKDKTPAYLLWCGWMIGLAGLHRIYLGRYGTGFLYLFTWGLFGFGQLFDLFQIGRMVEDENNRLFISQMGGAEALAAGAGPRALLGKRTPRSTEELQVSLAQAAEQHRGRLTVAEAVAATGRSFKDVERELNRMVVDGYIQVDNDEVSGVLVYQFGGAGQG
jgi:TM2 domain-containing membrane protein YozV